LGLFLDDEVILGGVLSKGNASVVVLFCCWLIEWPKSDVPQYKLRWFVACCRKIKEAGESGGVDCFDLGELTTEDCSRV
jgi:hypothetical protein